MPHTRLLSACAVALSCLLGASVSHAQSTDVAPATSVTAEPVVDSLRPRMMRAMVITAEAAKVSRRGVLGLMDENIRLQGVLAAQDRRLGELAARLHHLRTTVTDSLNRDIGALDAATLDARARRQALEARLAQLEASGQAASTSTSTSTSETMRP